MPSDNELFVGADFNALEDMINTLLTKDPNKLKVYLDGYDSHCLRAYYYFKEEMPDIEFYEEGTEVDTFMYNGQPISSNTLVEYQGKEGYLYADNGEVKFKEKL